MSMMSLSWVTCALAMVVAISGQDVPDYIVTFELFTNSSETYERLWPTEVETIANTSYNRCAKPIILVEGHNTGKDSPFMIDFARTLATVSNYNVIMANYYNLPYMSSVMFAGKQIATFIARLCSTYDINPSNVVLYGFSLGAHVAAFASREFKVGRLIATEPASVVFDALPRFFRVDRKDAEFVDVLHTSNVFGTYRDNLGHVNFVLDGGRSQNGCKYMDYVCSHLRVREFLKDSVTQCRFTFTKCPFYWAYLLKFCRSNPTLTFGFGLDPNSAPKDGSKYFYNTANGESPFCSIEDRISTYIDASIC